MSFLPSYDIWHPKYMTVFTYSSLILSITILLLIGTPPPPLNAITLDLSGDIPISNRLAEYIKLSVNHLLWVTDVPDHVHAIAV